MLSSLEGGRMTENDETQIEAHPLTAQEALAMALVHAQLATTLYNYADQENEMRRLRSEIARLKGELTAYRIFNDATKINREPEHEA